MLLGESERGLQTTVFAPARAGAVAALPLLVAAGVALVLSGDVRAGLSLGGRSLTGGNDASGNGLFGDAVAGWLLLLLVCCRCVNRPLGLPRGGLRC
ncbi:MAG TPA: hypothetical protein VGY76_09390 [Solirubrobacteraceae bacterium]|jgi:hypothetical protein|nr:hypothetical protein [Solirubrobacteraceae bacterium]